MRRCFAKRVGGTIILAAAVIGAVAACPGPFAVGADGNPEAGAVWKPADPDKALPGIVPYPAELPGVGRWQIIRVVPRCDIFAVTWSPDDRWIAHTDGQYVRIADPSTLEIQTVLVGHTAAVKSLAWSPNGKLIATGGEDNTVRLWDTTGALKHVMEGHKGTVNSVCFDPNSQKIASASRDGTVRICNIDGTQQRVLADLTGNVRDVDWSPDGETIVTGGDDRVVRLWSVDGKPGETFEGHFGPITTVAFSHDGKRIASGSVGAPPQADGDKPNAAVRIWDIDGPADAVCPDHKGIVTDVAWSPDDSLLVSTAEDRTVRFWMADGKKVAPVTNVIGLSVDWSSEGYHVAVVGRDSLKVLQLNRLSGRLHYLHPDHYFQSVAWSPDGKWVASLGRDFKIRLWRSDGRLDRTIDGTQARIQTITFSPDSQTIAGGGDGKVVQLWSLDGTPGPSMEGHEASIGDVAYSPDGKWIASSGGGDGTIRLWSPDGEPGPVLEGFAESVLSIAWSPDSTQLASGGSDANITFWDPVDGAFLDSWEVGHGDIDAVDYSPDGSMLAAGADGVWTLWTVDGEKQSEHPGHVDAVMSLKYSPDGQHVVTAGWDHSVRLWTPDGKPLFNFQGHTAPAYHLAWNPNSKQVASCGRDGAVHVWNVESGKPDWFALYLQEGEMVTFNSAGQVIDGEPEAIEQGLRYIVEGPDGGMEIIGYGEFLKRVRAAE